MISQGIHGTVENVDVTTSAGGQLARQGGDNVLPALRQGVQQAPGQIVVSTFIEHLGPALAECADALRKARAGAALHGVRVKDAEHLKGQVVRHHLSVFQGLEEDSNPALAVRRLKLAPAAFSSLGDWI